MLRIVQLVIALFVLAAPAVAFAQGGAPPGPPQGQGSQANQRPGVPDGRTIVDKDGVSHPRLLPPAVTLPAALGGRTITPQERDHPHSPSNSDKNRPLETGHRIGTPHEPAPKPPSRSEDPTGLLRLLSLAGAPVAEPVAEPSDQGGTTCVIGAIGGPNWWDNLPIFQSAWGQGWMGCSSTYGWVYYTYQELNLFRCWASFVGWCLPFQDSYVQNLTVCEARFTQQITWCGPVYHGHSNGPGEYFVRNDTWFQAPNGYASDYVDSALFWLR